MAFTFDFTQEKLEQILTGNKEVDQWFPLVTSMLDAYEINTVERCAAFLAQTGHESNSFKIMVENLNYSADGLRKVFSKYFPTIELANEYARKPEKIANRVYANRMGNGPEESGDGWRFRGHGLIQLTGHDNCAAFAKSIDKTIEEVVEYLQTKEGALESACWFWNQNGLNTLADKRDTLRITKRINGGTNGLGDRTDRFEKALTILG